MREIFKDSEFSPKEVYEGTATKSMLFDFLIVIHRSCRFYLSTREYEVLMFIAMRTYGWQKEEAEIAISQFLSGVPNRRYPLSPVVCGLPGEKFAYPLGEATLHRLLTRLDDRGLIRRTFVEGRPTKYRLTVSDKWARSEHRRLFELGKNREQRERVNRDSKPFNHHVDFARQWVTMEGGFAPGDELFVEGGVVVWRHGIVRLSSRLPTEFYWKQCVETLVDENGDPICDLDIYETFPSGKGNGTKNYLCADGTYLHGGGFSRMPLKILPRPYRSIQTVGEEQACHQVHHRH